MPVHLSLFVTLYFFRFFQVIVHSIVLIISSILHVIYVAHRYVLKLQNRVPEYQSLSVSPPEMDVKVQLDMKKCIWETALKDKMGGD